MRKSLAILCTAALLCALVWVRPSRAAQGSSYPSTNVWLTNWSVLMIVPGVTNYQLFGSNLNNALNNLGITNGGGGGGGGNPNAVTNNDLRDTRLLSFFTVGTGGNKIGMTNGVLYISGGINFRQDGASSPSVILLPASMDETLAWPTSTGLVSIAIGSGLLMDRTNNIISAIGGLTNTVNTPGVVLPGFGNNIEVWMTDSGGNPTWRLINFQNLTNWLGYTPQTNVNTVLPTFGYGLDASSNLTFTLDGGKSLATFQGYSSSTNVWAGPTNNLPSYGRYSFVANSDCSVTGFTFSAGAAIDTSTVLRIYNGASTNITFRWPISVTSRINSPRGSVTCTNGHMLFISLGFDGAVSTNISTVEHVWSSN